MAQTKAQLIARNCELAAELGAAVATIAALDAEILSLRSPAAQKPLALPAVPMTRRQQMAAAKAEAIRTGAAVKAF